jgi:ATP-dependent DNA helicase RecQ
VRAETATASDLVERLCRRNDKAALSRWDRLLCELLTAWREETADEPAPIGDCIEFLYESLMQRRRDEQFGDGVALATVHSAKGTEFPHVVLCGDWAGNARDSVEEERRTLYVGMTRAKESLAFFSRMDRRTPFARELTGPCFAPRRAAREAVLGDGVERDYLLLGLEDVFLDYAGRHSPEDPVHTALTALRCGSDLRMEQTGDRVLLFPPAQRVPVAQLSASAAREWAGRIAAIEHVQVVCMLTRLESDCQDPDYRKHLKAQQWEIPICEVVVRNGCKEHA